jgi:hypothetical protein
MWLFENTAICAFNSYNLPPKICKYGQNNGANKVLVVPLNRRAGLMEVC